jgi:hypothetical protein
MTVAQVAWEHKGGLVVVVVVVAPHANVRHTTGTAIPCKEKKKKQVQVAGASSRCKSRHESRRKQREKDVEGLCWGRP